MTRFQKYLLGSAIAHLLVFLFVFFFSDMEWKQEKPYKVTMINLSRGDGGTNLQSNFKSTKNLPQSTLREQKQALKDLAKDKQGSDLQTKQSTTKNVETQKISQKRTSDNGGLNLNQKKTKKIGRAHV